MLLRNEEKTRSILKENNLESLMDSTRVEVQGAIQNIDRNRAVNVQIKKLTEIKAEEKVSAELTAEMHENNVPTNKELMQAVNFLEGVRNCMTSLSKAEEASDGFMQFVETTDFEEDKKPLRTILEIGSQYGIEANNMNVTKSDLDAFWKEIK